MLLGTYTCRRAVQLAHSFAKTMGLREPAPIPTAIRIMEGNPGKRPLNGREPQPAAVEPRCPDPSTKWKNGLPDLAAGGWSFSSVFNRQSGNFGTAAFNSVIVMASFIF